MLTMLRCTVVLVVACGGGTHAARRADETAAGSEHQKQNAAAAGGRPFSTPHSHSPRMNLNTHTLLNGGARGDAGRAGQAGLTVPARTGLRGADLARGVGMMEERASRMGSLDSFSSSTSIGSEVKEVDEATQRTAPADLGESRESFGPNATPMEDAGNFTTTTMPVSGV